MSVKRAPGYISLGDADSDDDEEGGISATERLQKTLESIKISMDEEGYVRDQDADMLNWNSAIQLRNSAYRGYPAKRALFAMRKHGG